MIDQNYLAHKFKLELDLTLCLLLDLLGLTLITFICNSATAISTL